MTLTMPKLLGDGCVLQSGRPVHVWGWSAPRERITVRVGDRDARTVSAEDGSWDVLLDPLEAGGPYRAVIGGDGSRITRSWYAGEVFMCSGQSNMELPMQWVRFFFPHEFAREADPLLRQYKVVDRYDFSAPVRDHAEASWTGCSPDTVAGFSAVAYFFGRMVRRMLQVPVGLLNVSLGGSPLEAWIDTDAARGHRDVWEELKPYLGDGVARERSEASLRDIDAWMDELRGREIPSERLRWRSVTLPARFEDRGLPGFCGMLELRRTVMVPSCCAGEPGLLRLGTWSDIDDTYVNGVRVGGRPNQYEPRDYPIPSGVLRAGANEIAVRLICNAGAGRVTEGKAMSLQIGDETIDVGGVWRMAVASRMDRPCPSEDFVRWRPTGLYHAMLAPCFRFPVRAVLWYQGESNTGDRAARYGAMLADMIALWRRGWHDDELPFLIVQLPNIDIDCIEDGGWPLVRAGQWHVGRHVPHTKTVVTLDAGEANDLHPHGKRLIASRLFDAARTLLYGGDDTQPVVLDVAMDDGALRVFYGIVARAGSDPVVCAPTTLDGAEPGEFEFVWCDAACAAPAPATVDGSAVRVALPARRPDLLRYAWRNNPSRGLLVDGAGTPLPPFIYDLRRGRIVESPVDAPCDVRADDEGRA